MSLRKVKGPATTTETLLPSDAHEKALRPAAQPRQTTDMMARGTETWTSQANGQTVVILIIQLIIILILIFIIAPVVQTSAQSPDGQLAEFCSGCKDAPGFKNTLKVGERIVRKYGLVLAWKKSAVCGAS
ncbi:unnamed protein product [Lota lota]